MASTPAWRGTALGGVALIGWSLLALFTDGAQGIPPLQLMSMTFGVAFFIGFALLRRRGRSFAHLLRQPPAVWAVGIGGLFGYHFFYFLALGNAPIADANLIVFLWPLLIVMFSAVLPAQRLRWFHLLGVTLGVAGAGLLVLSKGPLALAPEFALGYVAAIASAVIWAGYCILKRRYAAISTDMVTGYCAGVAVLAFFAHLVFERSVDPNFSQSIYAVALGLGPIGAAFYCWDYATKHGDVQLLRAVAYTAPLRSTIFLVLAGRAEPSVPIFLACGLIVSSSAVASLDHLVSLRNRRRAKPD